MRKQEASGSKGGTQTNKQLEQEGRRDLWGNILESQSVRLKNLLFVTVDHHVRHTTVQYYTVQYVILKPFR